MQVDVTRDPSKYTENMELLAKRKEIFQATELLDFFSGGEFKQTRPRYYIVFNHHKHRMPSMHQLRFRMWILRPPLRPPFSSEGPSTPLPC